MATITFTDNLKRHIDCPEQTADGQTLHEVLNNLFANNQRLKGYVLDDQNRLRKHMLIAIDGTLITDKIYLSDPVKDSSEIYIAQALSGGAIK